MIYGCVIHNPYLMCSVVMGIMVNFYAVCTALVILGKNQYQQQRSSQNLLRRRNAEKSPSSPDWAGMESGGQMSYQLAQEEQKDEFHEQELLVDALVGVSGSENGGGGAAHISGSAASLRQQVETILLGGIAIWILLGFLIGSILPSFNVPTDTAIFIMGNVCCAICILYYVSPLSVLMEIIRKKDAAGLHQPMIALNLVASTMWAAYGLLYMNDVNVYAPNAVAMAFSVSQLWIKACYPSVAKDHEGDPRNDPELVALQQRQQDEADAAAAVASSSYPLGAPILDSGSIRRRTMSREGISMIPLNDLGGTVPVPVPVAVSGLIRRNVSRDAMSSAALLGPGITLPGVDGGPSEEAAELGHSSGRLRGTSKENAFLYGADSTGTNGSLFGVNRQRSLSREIGGLGLGGAGGAGGAAAGVTVLPPIVEAPTDAMSRIVSTDGVGLSYPPTVPSIPLPPATPSSSTPSQQSPSLFGGGGGGGSGLGLGRGRGLSNASMNRESRSNSASSSSAALALMAAAATAAFGQVAGEREGSYGDARDGDGDRDRDREERRGLLDAEERAGSLDDGASNMYMRPSASASAPNASRGTSRRNSITVDGVEYLPLDETLNGMAEAAEADLSSSGSQAPASVPAVSYS
jgi:uncharacterized protein with PQ loop repeat